MATITVTASLNMVNLTHANFDDLIINDGAIVTVNSPTIKCWKTVTINNGKLLIQNTSSITPVRFMMGRISGATANTITPTSGLGVVEITGSWIALGFGNGSPNQELIGPYTDYVPAIWVETASGSNDFEPWLNLTTEVGEALQPFRKGLQFADTGSAGKFFRQACIQEPYPTSYTGSVSASLTSVIRSGVSLLYTASLYCGDGARNGNTFPSQSRIRIPNIMFTDVTPLNLQTATSATQGNFVFTAGGIFKCNTALFDESYGNFTQAQICEMKNCAWSEYPLITECYNLTIDNVGFAAHPIRRYFGGASLGWVTRDARWGGTLSGIAWSYINGAYINRMYVSNYGRLALFSNQSGGTVANFTGTVYINNSTNLIVNELKTFNHFQPKSFDYGLALNFVNDSTFTKTEMYGGEAFNIQNSIGNEFTNITHSQGYHGNTHGFATSWRRGVDPETNQDFVLGQPYWFKFRSFRNTLDTTLTEATGVYYYNTGSEYVDSRPFSATPYTASGADAINHPDYFGVYPFFQFQSVAPTASLVWNRRDPFLAYEIFRQTASFTNTSSAVRIYSSSTVATVTYLDTESLSVGRPYYYQLRKHSYSGVFSDSAPQIFIPLLQQTASNLVLQSSAFNTVSWSKSAGTTATADQKQSPNDVPITTTLAPTGDLIVFTSATGSISQSIAFTSGSPYVFSVYVSALTSSVSMSLSASAKPYQISRSFVADQRWQRIVMPFTPTVTTTTGSVGIYGNGLLPAAGARVYLTQAQLNTGSMAEPHISTLNAALVQKITEQTPTVVRAWSRGTGTGIEIGFGALTGSSLHWELYCSTASYFTPSKTTLIADSHARGGGQPIYMLNAANNTFDGFKQINKNSGYGAVFLTLVNAASNNRFLNFDLDYNYTATNLINVSNLSNNNFIHNWKVGKFRNYTSANYLINAINNAQGLILQNVYCEDADIPLANLALDVELKGVSAANARPINSATSFALGSTTDSIGVAYGAVYDTIFNQLDWRNNTGSLAITFNASSKTQLPYELAGSANFANTGRLFFGETTGSSITYTWPNKIYGVTGFIDKILTAGNFQITSPFVNTFEFGTNTTTSFCLKTELAFKTGSDYGPWVPVNSALTASTFNPNTGFNLKIKLTAEPGIKYTNEARSFATASLRITGSLTGASAIVEAVEDLGTTGTLFLRNVTGSFSGSEVIQSNGLSYATCSQTAGTSRALIPNATSSINGFQLFVSTATGSFYPISQPTITLTGLYSGSKVDLIRESDYAILDAQSVSTTPTGSYTYKYDYYSNTPIFIVINNLGYVFQRIPYTLGDENVSIPIQQEIDRNYENPPGP
jgi:hypothetical protein